MRILQYSKKNRPNRKRGDFRLIIGPYTLKGVFYLNISNENGFLLTTIQCWDVPLEGVILYLGGDKILIGGIKEGFFSD